MKQEVAYKIMGIGFIVAFDVKGGEELVPDSFPDIAAGEPFILSKERAAELAETFYKTASPKYVNIRVQDHNGKDVYFTTIHRQY